MLRHIPWAFERVDGEPWGLVGMWSTWIDKATGEVHESYTMRTLNADRHSLLNRIHKPDPKRPPHMQYKRSVNSDSARRRGPGAVRDDGECIDASPTACDGTDKGRPGEMRHTETTTEDSLAMVRVAWQHLRAQYLKLFEMQKAGPPVDLTLLAQAFIDMNSALEATMVAVSRPTPLDEQGNND